MIFGLLFKLCFRDLTEGNMDSNALYNSDKLPDDNFQMLETFLALFDSRRSAQYAQQLEQSDMWK